MNSPAARPPFKLLFLCTGNSARSIFGEFLLRRLGGARFETSSAGSHPRGTPHPLALRVLREFHQIDASAARSKSWDEFRDVRFDIVITVCDHARESCPVWPGQPVVAHWGSPDPAEATGTEEEKLRAFKNVALQIRRRIELMCALPLETFGRMRLEKSTRAIGEQEKSQHAFE